VEQKDHPTNGASGSPSIFSTITSAGGGGGATGCNPSGAGIYLVDQEEEGLVETFNKQDFQVEQEIHHQ
jgi:hypothetical protein